MGAEEGDQYRGMESLVSSSSQITLEFVDVCYRVKYRSKPGGANGGIGRVLSCRGSHDKGSVEEERTVLNGISGKVSPGEILAVLGPSGSGKSTLLNILAGRLQANYTGSVLANGQPWSKSVSRRTGFVTQDDVLYPHLTVKETLVFCSLLRLPKTLAVKDKTRVAESVMAELGLAKCENTIIGNSFIRGVSGGERKRVSIGHEMLVNPSLLLLDEPTSGLDSTAAHRLVSTLGALARKGKTIVCSMHQPSSRVYQMFDSVLLLSEGNCLYIGKGSAAMDYFASVGFSPSFPMNPADFMLDLANGVGQIDQLYQCDHGEKPSVKQSLISSYNTTLAPRVKAAIEADAAARERQLVKGTMTTTTTTKQRKDEKRRSSMVRSKNQSSIGWFSQFAILLRRGLKERRHEAFSSLRVCQVIAAAMLAGAMWWRSDIGDVHDRLGLLFFISIFWGVFPAFNSVFTFPQERALFAKERASGMYTLSSYYVARLVGDLPMELLLPAAFGVVCYWMAGLRPDPVSFLLTMAILLGYVLVAQGLGLALGAAIMDAKQASTVVTVTMLAFLLTGGFYVNKVPAWMQWLKYTSFTYYCYKLLIIVQYGEARANELMGCARARDRDAGGPAGRPAGCGVVEEEVGTVVSVAALLVMFVGYRLLAYAALRRIKV